jgi:hypothetical protein
VGECLALGLASLCVNTASDGAAGGTEAGAPASGNDNGDLANTISAILSNLAQDLGNADGPGAWRTVSESMSERAASYQEQVTGSAASESYVVNGVKFDGYSDGVLQEAKGPGYSWAVRDGEFIPNYEGAQGLVEQAERQLAAAGDTPIKWSVAERSTTTAIENLFAANGISGINVVYVAPVSG